MTKKSSCFEKNAIGLRRNPKLIETNAKAKQPVLPPLLTLPRAVGTTKQERKLAPKTPKFYVFAETQRQCALQVNGKTL